MPDPAPLQLDIFAHSRDTMLRNDLIEAVSRRDADAARAAWTALGAEYADDAALAPASLLIEALAHPSHAPLPDLATAIGERRHIESTQAPAAAAVMGPLAAPRWLAASYGALARRAANLAYAAEAGEGHAAALWIAAEDWPEAESAVQRIASWRRMPQSLAWMAQARRHRQGLDAVWPLLTELAWLAPLRFAALAPRIADKALRKLLRGFESDYAGFDGEPSWVWFPAWALTESPLLAGAMAGAEPTRHDAPERAWQLVNSLLRVERRADDAERLRLRAELRQLNRDLFDAYMKPRR